MLQADASVYSVRADVSGGSTDTVEALSQTRYYYGISGVSASSNGQSFLSAVKTALNTSIQTISGNASTTWQVYLGSDYIVRFSHSSTSALVLNFLDSAAANSPTFRTVLGITNAGTLTVPASTVGTVDVLPRFWWSPEVPIHGTGPTLFDPSINVGVPNANTTAQQSSDNSMSFTHNGFNTPAEYQFTGVSPYWRIRPQVGHTNADLETWWRYGPALGNRVLMWRDRDNAVGVNTSAPSKGSASPYNYVEYYPNDALCKTFPAAQLTPANLYLWNVALGFNLTETGETPQ
jgi:hypothetical protein